MSFKYDVQGTIGKLQALCTYILQGKSAWCIIEEARQVSNFPFSAKQKQLIAWVILTEMPCVGAHTEVPDHGFKLSPFP